MIFRRPINLIVRAYLFAVVIVCGLGVFAIASASLHGYYFNKQWLYAWSPTPMALNTAWAFWFTGMAIIVLGYLGYREE